MNIDILSTHHKINEDYHDIPHLISRYMHGYGANIVPCDKDQYNWQTWCLASLQIPNCFFRFSLSVSVSVSLRIKGLGNYTLWYEQKIQANKGTFGYGRNREICVKSIIKHDEHKCYILLLAFSSIPLSLFLYTFGPFARCNNSLYSFLSFLIPLYGSLALSRLKPKHDDE